MLDKYKVITSKYPNLDGDDYKALRSIDKGMLIDQLLTLEDKSLFIQVCKDLSISRFNALLNSKIHSYQPDSSKEFNLWANELLERNKSEVSALNLAVSQGDTQEVKRLLIYGVQVDQDGLCIAMNNNHSEIVELLLCADKYNVMNTNQSAYEALSLGVASNFELMLKHGYLNFADCTLSATINIESSKTLVPFFNYLQSIHSSEKVINNVLKSFKDCITYDHMINAQTIIDNCLIGNPEITQSMTDELIGEAMLYRKDNIAVLLIHSGLPFTKEDILERAVYRNKLTIVESVLETLPTIDVTTQMQSRLLCHSLVENRLKICDSLIANGFLVTDDSDCAMTLNDICANGKPEQLLYFHRNIKQIENPEVVASSIVYASQYNQIQIIACLIETFGHDPIFQEAINNHPQMNELNNASKDVITSFMLAGTILKDVQKMSGSKNDLINNNDKAVTNSL
ncbi:MAG: ankyrin repeat domain-containing protein [Endozoicomonadaceae bacterium]|nr:ankyrin repeat domain-containing protein [Endozoicomonadaceae bacterium]